MNEFQLIQHYFKHASLSFNHPLVVDSIGDDCAEIKLSPGHHLHLSIDTLVEGVHFPKHASPFDIATRALCVSLSDLAAVAATPIAFTLAITLPKIEREWLSRFSEGLAYIAQKYQCPLIGGDTTKGESIIITIQVHGECQQGEGLKRRGAEVGDKVYVSGPLGDGAGALAQVLTDPLNNKGLAKQYYQPLPEIEFSKRMIGTASSCLDVSDGLVQDLNHICAASDVGMDIRSDNIPISELLLSTAGKASALQFALSGGDDYKLAYTAKHCDSGYCIGEVIAGDKVLVDGAEPILTGYQHF